MSSTKVADPPRVPVFRGLAFAAAIFVASRVGLLLATQSPPASPFWPATGITVVGLLVLGTSAWPWAAAGILATNLASHYGVVGSIGATAASTIGALVGAMLVQVLSRRTESLGSLSDATTTLLASAACALVAAIGAPAALVLSGAWHGPVGFAPVRTWFVGDMLGALLIVPLWLDVRQRKLELVQLPALVRWAVVLLLTAVVMTLLLRREGGAPLAFALFPLVVLSVLFVGPFAAHVIVFLLAVPVTWATMHGRGLYRHISINDGLMYAQAIMGTLGLTAQVVASVKRVGPLRAPALVMGACWLLFGMGYASYIRSQDELEKGRFEDVVSDVEYALGVRMTAYEEVLRATAARLSTAREDVDAATFQRWVESVKLAERHPGILGIGLATVVPEAETTSFLAKIQKLGVEAREVHEVSGGPFDWTGVARDGGRYVVSFIEPLAPNRVAVGLDLGSEPTRRLSADLSRDTGLATATAPLQLVQNGSAPEVLLYVPIYQGAPVDVASRRAALRGWVYAPIVGAQLFGAALERRPRELEVSVHDGATPVFTSPAFVAGKTEVVHALVFGQRKLTVRWQRGPMFLQSVDATGVWIGVFGAVVPLLLAGLMSSVQGTGLRAREMARQKTSILEQQGEMLEQATQAAESASRSKTAFLANTSHELRTPIAGILGMARLLLDSQLDREQRDHVRAIHRSGEALLALVNDILDIAKIESGKLELESIPFDVRQLLEDLSKGARVQAEEKGLSFLVRVEGDVAAAYLGDPVRIRQVLQNLVSNALKFTRKGEVEVSLRVQGDELRFAVRDTGIGIPQEVRARLFQSFSQADPTMTRKFGGTGLGLAISRELVERMGGVIGFESEPGRGSRFHFELHLSEAAAAPVEEESLDRIPVAREACDILLVEDNEVTATVGARVLERMGHRVTAVGNGREAIDALRLRFFDLVLMDCQMPVMDGFEATARIRAGEAGARQRDIPIVALTASAMKGDREASLASGMNDHLPKPLRAELLAEVIARHARNTRRSRPMSLDASVIASLEEVGGPEMLKSLVEMFAQQVPEALATMRAALAAGEGDRLKRAAHTLKSGAASLGAMSISAMAHGLEHGSLEAAASQLDELEAEHAVVMRLLEDLVRSEEQHP